MRLIGNQIMDINPKNRAANIPNMTAKIPAPIPGPIYANALDTKNK